MGISEKRRVDYDTGSDSQIWLKHSSNDGLEVTNEDLIGSLEKFFAESYPYPEIPETEEYSDIPQIADHIVCRIPLKEPESAFVSWLPLKLTEDVMNRFNRAQSFRLELERGLEDMEHSKKVQHVADSYRKRVYKKQGESFDLHDVYICTYASLLQHASCRIIYNGLDIIDEPFILNNENTINSLKKELTIYHQAVLKIEEGIK